MNLIRLMIVDDHELIRIGLRTVAEAEKDMAVVGDYGAAESALDNVERLHPDVVMMGVRLAGIDGIAACRQILNRLPDTKVVILTSHVDEDTIVSSIMAGASGLHAQEHGRARAASCGADRRKRGAASPPRSNVASA